MHSIINFRVIAIPQVSTACLSLVCSTSMATMIAKKGLTVPYRRIIFGLSISDIVQSLGFFGGPFAIPHDINNSWGIGNVRTCQADGFLVVVGMAAVPMYTCFLCFYYLCKLKFRMSNDAFASRMEWKIHYFIIIYNMVMSSAALMANTLHPTIFKTVCTLAVTPLGCRVFPQIVGQCDPTIFRRVNHFVLVNNLILAALCFFGMIGIMGMLYCHAMVMNRMSPPTGGQERVGRLRNNVQEVDEFDDSMMSSNLESSTNDEGTPPSSPNSHALVANAVDNEQQPISQPQAIEDTHQTQTQNQATHLSSLYKKEMLLQGCLYVVSFCVIYFPVIISFGYLLAKVAPPKHLQISLFTILPMGGFLNILVYTRPQVASLRRNYPRLSRLRGLWLVLRSGGEIPVLTDLPNFLIQTPSPPLAQESMSEVQIGLASRPPSELAISGLRSNLGTNRSSSLSFGTSAPSESNVASNVQHLESIQEADDGSSSSQNENGSIASSSSSRKIDKSTNVESRS